MNAQSRSAEFLNKVLDNAVMGAEAVKMLFEMVEDDKMMSELKREYEDYGKHAKAAIEALASEGLDPEKQGAFSKLGLWSGIQLNTLTSRSNDKLAEIVIQGAVMGVIDLTRLLKEYSEIPDGYRKIAEDLISFEEDSVQKMKGFLG